MKYIHGANQAAIARANHEDATLYRDYSANINPASSPDWLKDIYHQAFNTIFTYPDIEYYDLKKAICEYEDANDVFLGNGASPLIFDLVHHLNIKEATILMPTFSEYEQALSANQAIIKQVISFDYASTLKEITETGCLFICNPNNPTGSLVNKTDILDYRKRYPNTILIIDESFMDFTDKRESCLNIEDDRLYVIKSYTKFFQCPGLRMGALFTSNLATLATLKLKSPPWAVNGIIDKILPYYLKDKAFIKESHELIKKERVYLQDELKRCGFKVYPSTVNFILFEADFDLASACIKKHVILRDCASFVGVNTYTYRICVSHHEKNKTLIETMNAIMAKENL